MGRRFRPQHSREGHAHRSSHRPCYRGTGRVLHWVDGVVLGSLRTHLSVGRVSPAWLSTSCQDRHTPRSFGQSAGPLALSMRPLLRCRRRLRCMVVVHNFPHCCHVASGRWLTLRSSRSTPANGNWPSFHSGPIAVCRCGRLNSNVKHFHDHTRLMPMSTLHSLLARLKVYDPKFFRFDEIALLPRWKRAVSVSLWILKLLSGIVIALSMWISFSWKVIVGTVLVFLVAEVSYHLLLIFSEKTANINAGPPTK